MRFFENRFFANRFFANRFFRGATSAASSSNQAGGPRLRRIPSFGLLERTDREADELAIAAFAEWWRRQQS